VDIVLGPKKSVGPERLAIRHRYQVRWTASALTCLTRPRTSSHVSGTAECDSGRVLSENSCYKTQPHTGVLTSGARSLSVNIETVTQML